MADRQFETWLQEENLTLLTGWARDGLTYEQIAKNIGVNVKTLWEWRKGYLPISNALKKGREVADYEVENAMFKSATGYYIEEEKKYIKRIDGNPTEHIEKTRRYVPPNVTAQIFWSKNRNPEKWRDRIERHDTVTNKSVVIVDDVKEND